jgi:hypothetical protein
MFPKKIGMCVNELREEGPLLWFEYEIPYPPHAHVLMIGSQVVTLFWEVVEI